MRCFVLLSIVLLVPCYVAASDRHCLGPGDINADHVVDLGDQSFFADCVAGPGVEPGLGCLPEYRASADFDRDGDVDLADVALFAQKLDNTYFDYGPYREDKEAEHLAIKLTGELRAPDYEYERINRDLSLMRYTFLDLLDVGDFRQYGDNGLFVRVFSNDNRDEFDRFNSFYLVTHDQEYDFSPGLHFIEFCDIINPVALDPIYSESSEVEYAGPNFNFCAGCCGSGISVRTSNDLFEYDIFYYYEKPHGDLCGCWRNRVLETDYAGNIVQVCCTDACLPGCP